MLSLFSEPQEDNSFESLNLHVDAELQDEGSVIKVQPHNQTTVLLGVYTPENTPRGFSISITPEPEAADSVIAQVTSSETDHKHEFMLYVNNMGSRALTAEARPL